MSTIRCPHCGSPVRVLGNRWECGWCGDFGKLSSLSLSEQAKLKPESSEPNISLEFEISVIDDTLPPRQYTCTELEDMVRRWDLSENRWICRDLLIAYFPKSIEQWTAEEIENMDTQELLSKIGENDPKTAIQMMKLLLDTAESHLQEPEVAEQLLECELCGLYQNQSVQFFILEQLKNDKHLAQQLFKSAYVGECQDALLDACDWFGEVELKVYIQQLLGQNPYFDKFRQL